MREDSKKENRNKPMSSQIVANFYVNAITFIDKRSAYVQCSSDKTTAVSPFAYLTLP